MRTSWIVVALLTVTGVGPLFAQRAHAGGSEAPAQEPSAQELPRVPTPPGIETAEEDEYGHVHFHEHHLGLFIGGSRLKQEDGFTVGGEYEYRLHQLLGLGFEAEYAGGDLRETVAVFPVFFHPGAGLKLAAGPGFERATEEVTGPEANTAGEKRTNFLFRVSILYDFPVKERCIISPGLSLDFVNGRQVWVYGVTFGVGF